MFSLIRHSARLATTTVKPSAAFSVSAKQLEKNLYLGNLSWSLTPETLRQAIITHVTEASAEQSEEGAQAPSPEELEGHLQELSIITDRLSGRSRGYGFLKIQDDNVGEQVLAALADCEVEGRQLNCREAESRPAYDPSTRPPRRQYDGGDRRGGGGGGYGRGDRAGGYGGGYGGDRRGGDRGYGGERDGGYGGRGRRNDGGGDY